MTTWAADISRVIEAAQLTRRLRHTAKPRQQLQLALRKAFEAQGRTFLRRFAKHRASFTAAEVGLREVAEPTWEPDWEAVALASLAAFTGPLSAAVQRALQLGAAQIIGQFALDTAFDLANPRAVAYVEAHGAELVTAINDETRSRLQTLIGDGVAAGDSYTSIAKAIGAEFRDMSRERAQLIATTEVGMAYEAGNSLMAAQLIDAGIEIEKSWLTVGDASVDADCQANQDAGWIAYDAAFPSGDMEPLSHPRCRCTALYRRVGSDNADG